MVSDVNHGCGGPPECRGWLVGMDPFDSKGNYVFGKTTSMTPGSGSKGWCVSSSLRSSEG